MNPVVHFEMPAEDRKRMADFYTNAFGWKTNQLGPDMGDYVIVHTTETDENNMVKTPGTINGGFYQKKNPNVQGTNLVISVDNLEESIEKVKAGGGTIVGEAMDVPGIGRYAMFLDTEGNRVAMLQPKR